MGASLDAIWAEVQRLNEKLDALPGLIEVNGNQVKVVSLDELSENLGLIKAGEFRAGNLRSPGDSFSGVRIGYPGFYYPSTSVAGSDLYHIAGVDLDTLAVGISATDGKLYFGAGAGWLDDTGIILAIAGGSSVTPPIKWLDANLLTYRSAITTFNILGDTNSLSFELMSGGLGFTTDLGTYAQMNMSAWAQTIDTGASTGDFYHLNLMNIKAGPSDLTTSTSNTIFDWLYLLERVSDSADFEQVLLLSVYHEMDTAGKFQIRWNPGNKDNHFNVWRGGVAENKLFSLSTEGALWGGANIPDTVTFDIGWLRESAITFNSTATAGIEDPDNEMGKLWLDTDAELRLTDTAGEDWFVTKSTSTGGGDYPIISTGTTVTIPQFSHYTSQGTINIGDNVATNVFRFNGSDTSVDYELQFALEVIFSAGPLGGAPGYATAHGTWRGFIRDYGETGDAALNASVVELAAADLGSISGATIDVSTGIVAVSIDTTAETVTITMQSDWTGTHPSLNTVRATWFLDVFVGVTAISTQIEFTVV